MERVTTYRKYRPGILTVLTALFLLLFINITFTSCNDDIEEVVYSYGMIKNDKEGQMTVLLDKGESLNVVNYEMFSPVLRDSLRVVAYFSVLEPEARSYDVELKAVDTILTKPILKHEESILDSVGNDPIDLIDAWVAHNHLNIKFSYYGAYPTPMSRHMINMLYTENENGAVNFEFRHNAFGDRPDKRYNGHASFKLEELFEDIQRPYNFTIKFKSDMNRDQTITVQLK